MLSFSQPWRRNPLKSIVSFSKGSGISKGDLSEQGRNCILYGQLYTDYSNVTQVNQTTLKTSLNQSDLVISLAGQVLIPASGETHEDISNSVVINVSGVLIGGDINILTPKQEILGSFLACCFRGVRKKQIASLAQGDSVVHLNSNNLNKLIIDYPSIDEQARITTFIRLLEARIEVQNKIINNLLSLKKTINNVLFEAYSPSIIFKECYLKAKEGGTPDTNNKLFYEHGTIPFAKIDDLSGKYIASTKSYISEKGLVKSSAWLIPAQSVLLSNGATIGECSITQCVLCTKQGIVGIIPSEIITSDFMYYFFKTNKFRKLIVRITTRGTMETAYIKDIEKIRIPLPKKDEQIRHAKIMNSFEHKIDNEKRILEHLLTQKKFFLNNLFI